MFVPHSLRSLRHFFLLALLFLFLGIFALPHAISATQFLLGGTTTRVSIASDGTEGNGYSNYSTISADGRYVAFQSQASNLVSNDTNSSWDIFVHDLEKGITARVSVASGGIQGNEGSLEALMSADGQYVTFSSYASNLVPNDTNGVWDVFIHERETGVTSRVSLASSGTQGNNISESSSISVDGRYVAFQSSASNLVPNDTNGVFDIFVHDRETGITARVSVASDGTQANNTSFTSSISADGRYVVFRSTANNLVANDTNNVDDIFVYDRQTGTTSRVSIASNGTEGNNASEYPSISTDGRYIAFHSGASNLIVGDTNNVDDVFVHDRQTGQTNRISVASDGTQGNSYSYIPSILANSRYIAFRSYASNLVADDTNNVSDIFVHDWQTGTTSRVSLASDGTQGNDHSSKPAISADGRYVAFDSVASNLVVGDTNNTWDVFVRDQGEPTTSTPTITPTSSSTPIPSPSSTSTVTNPGATLTPTPTPTLPTSEEEVFVPLVLRQYGFATPSPATPTPTVTATPLPTCEVLDHEPNNYFLEANGNLPLCESGTVIGTVASNDIDDIYRIEVVTSGIVRIDLTDLPTGADYDLYLYNAERGEVTVANTPGSVNEIIRINIPNGRYYLRVYSRTYAGANTYALRWVQE
jgi:hypothetical protein